MGGKWEDRWGRRSLRIIVRKNFPINKIRPPKSADVTIACSRLRFPVQHSGQGGIRSFEGEA